MKIYGESLCRDVPYKTLLLSVRDNAAYVVKEMLDKYGLDKEDPATYCLVQASLNKYVTDNLLTCNPTVMQHCSRFLCRFTLEAIVRAENIMEAEELTNIS